MFAAAMLLASIGAADLLRTPDAHRLWVRVRCVALATAVAALLAWGSGYHWLWIMLLAALSAAWVVTTTRADDAASPWPPIVLAVLVTAALASAAALPAPAGWLTDWHVGLPYSLPQSMPFENAALIAAYSLFLVNSANVVVRAILSLTDARIQRGELRIKGGRVIGPIERIFLFWMALAGQLLAIGAILAAKGILRYPEISGKKSNGALAEYVLIGSLVSWGLALVLVPLLAVG